MIKQKLLDKRDTSSPTYHTSGAQLLENSDLVMITAAHTTLDYDFVQKHSRAVFDTKNVMKNIADRTNIEKL